MHFAVPLLIAAPFFGAILLSVIGGKIPRWLIDGFSIAVALFAFYLSLRLAFATRSGPFVYWFGGWHSEGNVTPGICFFVDLAGAGLAAFTSLLMAAAFSFSIFYFKEVKGHFHALMLLFLGAMCAFALSGDLFNLFVWFELMTGAGIALCGYKVEELGPLQGAMNFAVTNTIGAFLGLTGIILIYAHTGALNMAQVGQFLDKTPGDPLVVVAFLFISCGFLVKAAVVPFHFWLADAHAVAPTPVCVLFSGVMVELGLYAVARIYWSVFSPVLNSHVHTIHLLFLIVGVVTSLLGGVMCFLQRHLKRLLAYSTISHMGLMLIGVSLLNAEGIAGTALYVLGHGMIKAALFICVGVLLNEFGCVDEQELRGRGRGLLGLQVLFGALGLAGLPPFIDFKGVAIIEHAAEAQSLSWVSWIFILAGALTTGAVLRVWGRVFRGWGVYEKCPADESSGKNELPETTPVEKPGFMYFPAIVLLGLSIALAWVSPFVKSILTLGPQFVDHTAYISRVLNSQTFPALMSVTLPSLGKPAVHSIYAFVLACCLAGFGLRYRRTSKQKVFRAVAAVGKGLHSLHSGEIGDYVAWFVTGVALFMSVVLWT